MKEKWRKTRKIRGKMKEKWVISGDIMGKSDENVGKVEKKWRKSREKARKRRGKVKKGLEKDRKGRIPAGNKGMIERKGGKKEGKLSTFFEKWGVYREKRRGRWEKIEKM